MAKSPISIAYDIPSAPSEIEPMANWCDLRPGGCYRAACGGRRDAHLRAMVQHHGSHDTCEHARNGHGFECLLRDQRRRLRSTFRRASRAYSAPGMAIPVALVLIVCGMVLLRR